MLESHSTLRPRESPPSFAPRLGVIALLILLTFAILVSRLWRLQVQEGENLRSLSENNRLRLKRTPPLRGVVYDRQGRVLVDNRPSFNVVLVPEDAPDVRATLHALSDYVPDTTVVRGETLPHNPRRPSYEGVVLAKDVAWSTLVAVEAHQVDIPGVDVEVSTKRQYPPAGLAAHLLGYVGEVNSREMSLFPGYRLGDLIGKFGIEKKWEAELRGQGGGQQIEVDATGKRLRVLGEVEARAGKSLLLTLDRDLQQKAEAALEGREGAIVVLDVHTGDVLAMASRPVFDPNVFARGIKLDEWHSLLADPLHPLSNRAIQGQYPPGSTFKVLMAAAALEKGVITPATRFSCSGGLPFGNHVFHCWKKGGHGSLDLQQAIAQSCDVYFYQVGQRLGINSIAEYARRFGLGQPLGIALDHEAGGVIPDPAWKKEVLNTPWFAGETLSVVIGQGYVTVTPLQMAVVAATIANGGTVYRPRVVRQVTDDESGTVKEYEPEVINKVGLKPETVQLVQAGMRDVVNSPTGTGKKAQLPDILVAGKTGTSQVIAGTRGKGKTLPRQYRDHAWFIAFAPADNPEVAVACLLEHAGEGGGAAAAPVVRQVLADYFALTRGEKPEHAQVRPKVDITS
ncbi:MAG: penicillin-binding protein 2 [Deltaproteobacteria bacterium]|nr:penicillin-binding protein 2 [Deltaproteobacteria bacterium]